MPAESDGHRDRIPRRAGRVGRALHALPAVPISLVLVLLEVGAMLPLATLYVCKEIAQHDSRPDQPVVELMAERAGYSRVRATPTEMNRRQPLDPSMRQLMLSLFAFLATEARKVCLDSEDQHAWSALERTDDSDHPLQQPGFCYRAVQWTVVGSA